MRSTPSNRQAGPSRQRAGPKARGRQVRARCGAAVRAGSGRRAIVRAAVALARACGCGMSSGRRQLTLFTVSSKAAVVRSARAPGAPAHAGAAARAEARVVPAAEQPGSQFKQDNLRAAPTPPHDGAAAGGSVAVTADGVAGDASDASSVASGSSDGAVPRPSWRPRGPIRLETSMLRMRALAKAEAAAAVERRKGEAPPASSVRPVAARLLLRELGANAAPGIGGAPARARRPPAAPPALAPAAAALQASAGPPTGSLPCSSPGGRLRRLRLGRPAVDPARLAAVWPGLCAAVPLERAGRGGVGRLVAMTAVGSATGPHSSAGAASVAVLHRSRGEAAVLRLLPAGPLLRRGQDSLRLRHRVPDAASGVAGAGAADSGAQLLLGAPLSGPGESGAIDEWGCFRLTGAAAAATQLDAGPGWRLGACLEGDVRAAVLLAEPGTPGPRMVALLGGGRGLGGRAGDRGAGVVTRLAWADPGAVPGAESGQLLVGGMASGVVCLWDLRASSASPQAIMPMSQSDRSFAPAAGWSPVPLKPRWAMQRVAGVAGRLSDLWRHGAPARPTHADPGGAWVVSSSGRGASRGRLCAALGGLFAPRAASSAAAAAPSPPVRGAIASARAGGGGSQGLRRRGPGESAGGAFSSEAASHPRAQRPRFGLASAGQARPKSRFGLQLGPAAQGDDRVGGGAMHSSTSTRTSSSSSRGGGGFGRERTPDQAAAASVRQGRGSARPPEAPAPSSSSRRAPVSGGSRFGLLSLSAGRRASKRQRAPSPRPTSTREAGRGGESAVEDGPLRADGMPAASTGGGSRSEGRCRPEAELGFAAALQLQQQQQQTEAAEQGGSGWKDPWSQWPRDRPTAVVGSSDGARRSGAVSGLAFSAAGQGGGSSAVACAGRGSGGGPGGSSVAGSTSLLFVGRAGGLLEAVDCRKLTHSAFGSDPAPAAMLRVRAAAVVARALNRGGAARAAAGVAQPVAARLGEGVSRLLPAGAGSLLLQLADGSVAWLDAASGTCESAWAPRTPFAAAAPDVCALWRGTAAVAVGGAPRAAAVARVPPAAWAAGAGGALREPFCSRSAMACAAPVEAAHAVMGGAEGLSAVCQLGPGAALAGTREGDLVGIIGM